MPSIFAPALKPDDLPRLHAMRLNYLNYIHVPVHNPWRLLPLCEGGDSLNETRTFALWPPSPSTPRQLGRTPLEAGICCGTFGREERNRLERVRARTGEGARRSYAAD